MIKNCVICGKPFEIDDYDRNVNKKKYCSLDCVERAKNKRNIERRKNGKKQARNVECDICGKIFLTTYVQKVTCSPECKYERDKRLARENDKRRREAIKNGTWPRPGRTVPKQKKIETLAEIQKKAKEAGMSYGQYMQAEYMRKMQEGRMANGGC